ncbi:MAG: hypothetical protein WDN46_19395 [Methylocella sp.]
MIFLRFGNPSLYFGIAGLKGAEFVDLRDPAEIATVNVGAADLWRMPDVW